MNFRFECKDDYKIRIICSQTPKVDYDISERNLLTNVFFLNIIFNYTVIECFVLKRNVT